METTILKSIAMALFVSVGLLACKDKDPAPDKTITMKNVAAQYFVVEKNAGRLLSVIYFVNDGGTKFYFDASSTRRIGTPLVSNVDAGKGTATLTLDLDGNGVNVFVFDLLKANDSSILITQSTYQGATSTITSANIYKVSDLDGFSYESMKFEKSDEAGDHYNACTFSATTMDYESGFFTIASEDRSHSIADYYPLQNNVGFKVESASAFGALFKKDGKLGIILDGYDGVRELGLVK